MHEHYTPKDLARFWRKVNKTFHFRGCWIWTAALTSRGYGTFGINGHVVSATRLSYFFANGEFPSELCVLHKCDNPACVNPDHLFLGTQKQNVEDMIAKGRKNETVYPMKISRQIADEILAKWESGDFKRKELAEQYSITPQMIGQIILRHSWK